MLFKTQKKTTRFLLFAVSKPCYVRATEICSTFSCATPHKLVAWGRIELPTRGFSIHMALKCLAFMRVVAVFCVTCDIPCYRKT